VLWLSGPSTIEEHIRPSIQAAADASGRPTPRIVASVPVCVTDNPDDVRNAIAGILAGYNELPSYRAMMDREGVDGPAGVSIVGSEDVVRAELQRFADAGATDFAAVEFGTNDGENSRTRALLKELAAA
jgi:5,10-methylenetetrahydromethanopterin reductase